MERARKRCEQALKNLWITTAILDFSRDFAGDSAMLFMVQCL